MTCKYPTCSNPVGQADPAEYLYKNNVYCSPECETKHDHLKMDAKDAQESVTEEADTKEAYF